MAGYKKQYKKIADNIKVSYLLQNKSSEILPEVCWAKTNKYI